MTRFARFLMILGVFGLFTAQADILTETPYYWYKFDGDLTTSSGSASLSFSAQSSNNNAASPWDKALSSTGSGPYGKTFNLPSGDWTYHIRALMPANLDKGVVWNITTCGGANGLLLLTRGNDAGLTLARTSAAKALETSTAVDIDATGLSTGYHNITAVYSLTAKTVQLYIDGVAAGAAFSYTANTGDQGWQWFSAHGSCNGTTAGVGVYLEEVRFYQRGLTEAEIATLGNYQEPGITSYKLTADADWSAAVPDAGKVHTLDLDGHTLTVASLADLTYVTDTSTGAPGTVVLNVSETVENTTATLSGNLRLVKEGAGTYVNKIKGHSYAGGTVVNAGTIKSSDSEKYYFYGAHGSQVTVNAGGTVEINGKYDWNVHSFVLNGGVISNIGGNLTTTGNGGIGNVTLTADSKIVAKYHIVYWVAD